MKARNPFVVGLISVALLLSSCASMNKTQKGAVIGVAVGGAVVAIIG